MGNCLPSGNRHPRGAPEAGLDPPRVCDIDKLADPRAGEGGDRPCPPAYCAAEVDGRERGDRGRNSFGVSESGGARGERKEVEHGVEKNVARCGEIVAQGGDGEELGITGANYCDDRRSKDTVILRHPYTRLTGRETLSQTSGCPRTEVLSRPEGSKGVVQSGERPSE
jgi:hypothetical protein